MLKGSPLPILYRTIQDGWFSELRIMTITSRNLTSYSQNSWQQGGGGDPANSRHQWCVWKSIQHFDSLYLYLVCTHLDEMIGDEHIDVFLDTLKNPTYFPHLKRVVIKASSFDDLLWPVVNLNSKSKDHIRQRLVESAFQSIETIVMWFLFLFFLGKSYVLFDWSSWRSDHWTLLCSLFWIIIEILLMLI